MPRRNTGVALDVFLTDCLAVWPPHCGVTAGIYNVIFSHAGGDQLL